jgi:hypothetical protein
MLRRKVMRELESMEMIRESFMLGYISYVWKFFSLEDAHKVFEKIPQQYDLKPL